MAAARVPALAALLLAAGLVAAPARAAAPEPQKPADPSAFTGRWYEVARIHNMLQLDCEAPTMDFAVTGPGKFTLTQTCRKGSPSGKPDVHKGAARVTDARTNAKIRVGFFGGMVQKDYWLIDHVVGRWALLATPDARFMWVLSRKPVLPERDEVLAKAKALGFNLSKIEFAKQPPA